VIAQVELAKAVRDPSQPLSGPMGIRWMGIGSPDDFSKEPKSRIVESKFIQDRVERRALARVPTRQTGFLP
jgi:hypothetical protein